MTDTKPRTPDLDELPLLAAALGRHDKRFRKALSTMAGYLAAGGIPNARYEEIRPSLMDGLSEAWNAGVPLALMDIARTGRDNGEMFREGSVPNRARALSYELDMNSSGGLAVFGRVGKRLAQAIADHKEEPFASVLSTGPALLAEIAVAGQAMAWLHQRRMKRPPPGSAPPAPELPRATMEAQAAVRTRMREILGDLREAFAERVVEHVREQAGKMEAACTKMAAHLAEAAAARKAAVNEGRRPDWREANDARKLRDTAAHHRQVGKHMADYDPNTYEVRRHADGDARAKSYAAGEVERVFHLWTERNVEKLAAIAEAKGGITMDVLSARVSYGGVETEMRVSFPDGARMGFSNAIEYATSPLGLPFARFPARYHDVVRPDGTRLRGPSEARVKLEFVPAARSESEPEPTSPWPGR